MLDFIVGDAAVAGVVSHALLDGIGHDDVTVGVISQAALVAAGFAAVALSWGPGRRDRWRPRRVVPDAEIILMKLRGQRTARLLFPSHWQREGRRGSHPYRLPGPGVPIGVEVALSLAVCAALCMAARRRSRRSGRGR